MITFTILHVACLYNYILQHFDFSFPGKQDSSGLRLTMTPALRKYDVGTLDMGVIEGIFVPPRANIFNVTGYCHSTCTNQVEFLSLSNFGEYVYYILK